MKSKYGFGERVNNQVTQNQSRGKVANGHNGNSPDYTYDKSDPLGIMYRYTDMKDYYETEGENAYENTVKGFMNRLRSAPGEAVEDLSYLLYDLIPEDAEGKLMRWLRENAGNVVDKNTAGQIGKRATEQFGLAKEDTGYFGDRVIDAMDSGSSMLGYAMTFGPSHLALSQSIGGGLNEYRNRRENGTDVSEALSRGVGTGLISYGIERLGGLGADNSVMPKINYRDVKSVFNAVTKTALQEGGEEAAEYTANSFMNSLADAVYKGKLSIDWNVEDAFNNAVTGAMVGGGLATVPAVNVRDIDIVDEMNKIVTEETDVNTKIANAQKLKDSLGWRKKAKNEVNDLLYYLKNDKAKGINKITRNAWGKPIAKINHGVVIGAPNSITEVINEKGGAVRNYYNNGGFQYKQIANNNENHKVNNLDNGGIHAHNYHLGEKGIPKHGKTRRMSVKEILENEGWI